MRGARYLVVGTAARLLGLNGAMGERAEVAALPAYRAGGDGPCVVVLHEWWGLVPHIEDVCDRLAAHGFAAVAPDLYDGATAPNAEPDEAQKLLMKLDRDRAVGEVAAVIA